MNEHMDAFEQPKQEPEDTFQTFQTEVQACIDRENSGEVTAAHLRETELHPELDVSALTPEDERVWQTLKEGELTHEMFEEYRDSIPLEETNRLQFMAFVAHEIMRRDKEAQEREN